MINLNDFVIIAEGGLEDYLAKHGVEEKECGLGFSEKEQKWYGYSHRGVYGFGIGDKVKKGHLGYREDGPKEIKTLDDAKAVAKAYAQDVD
jgi:hypothetical protein